MVNHFVVFQLLISTLGLSSHAAQQRLIKLQEILTVEIRQSENDAQHFDASNLYVEFEHGDQHFTSLSLSKPDACTRENEQKSKIISLGNVNGCIVVDEGCSHLQCEIKKSRILFPDKTVGKAVFNRQQLQFKDVKERRIKASIKDPYSQKELPLKLELSTQQLLWRDVGIHSPEQTSAGIDLFFTIMAKFFAWSAKKTKNPKAGELKVPVDDANPDLEMIVELDNITKFPKDDEFHAVDGFTKTLFQGVNMLPFDDRATHFKSRDHGIRSIRELLDDLVPQPEEGRWEDPTGDQRMRRVFFSSMGMFFLEKVPDFDGGYVADLTSLCKYPCRKNDNHNYETFGCKTFFDKNGNIERIEEQNGDVYKPKDEYWEWAKLKSRSSAFVQAALVHVAEYHYVWGNVPGAAMRMFLPPHHPMRRALTVHFFKTHYTCARAKYSLFDKAGILSRGLSMDYETGLEMTFKDIISNFEFSVFSEVMKKRGLTDCEFHVGATDGVELHKIIGDYVSGLFDAVYPKKTMVNADKDMRKVYKYLRKNMKGIPEEYTLENLKKVWGEIIFRVTGYHSAIGQVSAFALDPSMVNIRLQPKQEESLVTVEEGVIAVALITAITTVPCPKIGDDWKQVFDKSNTQTMQAYKKLRKDLKALGRKIDNKNKVRDTNIDFHPDFCAISISS